MTVSLPTPARGPVPGPAPKFLIGNAPEFRRGFLHAMTHGFERYGDLVRFRVGPREFLIASHPDLAQHVLVDHGADFPKRDARLALGLVLGNGLVTNVDHASWLTQRRMMQPMFHRSRLASMGDKMTASASRLVDRLAARAGTVVDLAEEMTLATLDIITQTMFSADLGGDAGRIGPAVSVGTRFAQSRVAMPFAPPLSWPTPANRTFLRERGVLYDAVEGLVRERRASGPGPGDLLDMLLEARDADTGEAMSDTQLRDEVLTIFAAGHETTANTLSLAWWALSQRADLREQLHAELDTVLGGRVPTMDDLPKLPFTRAVLDETLRLYPAAPVTSPRRAAKDSVVGGYSLPAETVLFVSIYNIHRHPAFWARPSEFDPDRFLSGALPAHRLAYLPFGAGARKCIGTNLAVMEGVLLLAALASRFEFRPRPDFTLDLEQAITLRPRHGLPMTVLAR